MNYECICLRKYAYLNIGKPENHEEEGEEMVSSNEDNSSHDKPPKETKINLKSEQKFLMEHR